MSINNLVSIVKREVTFEALLVKQEPGLRKWLTRRLPSHAVDDVLQETRLAAWQGFAAFEARSSFKTWLYGIAEYKAFEALRRDSRVRERQQALMEEWVDPDSRYSQADLAVDIRSAIASLSTDQREAIESIHGGGKSLKEHAQSAGRNINTVKYHYYAALKVLEDKLSHDQ